LDHDVNVSVSHFEIELPERTPRVLNAPPQDIPKLKMGQVGYVIAHRRDEGDVKGEHTGKDDADCGVLFGRRPAADGTNPQRTENG
jgi:hypothetical protein